MILTMLAYHRTHRSYGIPIDDALAYTWPTDFGISQTNDLAQTAGRGRAKVKDMLPVCGESHGLLNHRGYYIRRDAILVGGSKVVQLMSRGRRATKKSTNYIGSGLSRGPEIVILH